MSNEAAERKTLIDRLALFITPNQSTDHSDPRIRTLETQPTEVLRHMLESAQAELDRQNRERARRAVDSFKGGRRK